MLPFKQELTAHGIFIAAGEALGRLAQSKSRSSGTKRDKSPMSRTSQNSNG